MRGWQMAAGALPGLLLVGAGLAQAQGAAEPAPATSQGVLAAIRACRTIQPAEARLACFERTTATLDEAVARREVRIIDRQEIRTARRSLFGFTIPRLALFGGNEREEASAPDREEFAEINTTVVRASPAANGRVQMTVAEGDAVWLTTEPLAFPPRPGTKLRIRKGALGNYFLSIDGERSVRGMRVR